MKPEVVFNRTLWLLNITLGLGVLVFAYQFLLFGPEVRSEFSVKPWREPTPHDLTVIADLHKLRLTGVFTPNLDRLDPTTLPKPEGVTLIGSIPPDLAILQAASLPALEQPLAIRNEPVLHEGKPIRELIGWVLSEVRQDEVVFRNGSRKAIIHRKTADAPPRRPSPSFSSRKIDQGENREHWHIDQAEFDYVRNSFEDILRSDVKLSVHGGGGLRIDEVLPGSLVEQRGFCVGEVLLHLGGTPLDNPSKFRDFFEKYAIQPGGTVSVELRRAGRSHYVHFRIPRT